MKSDNTKRRLELKYASIYMFDKEDNYHGEILGVEWVSAGRDSETKQTWTAGWRASISEVQLKEDGSGLSKKDAQESVTYEINRELIAMIIESPYNTFLINVLTAAINIE